MLWLSWLCAFLQAWTLEGEPDTRVYAHPDETSPGFFLFSSHYFRTFLTDAVSSSRLDKEDVDNLVNCARVYLGKNFQVGSLFPEAQQLAKRHSRSRKTIKVYAVSKKVWDKHFAPLARPLGSPLSAPLSIPSSTTAKGTKRPLPPPTSAALEEEPRQKHQKNIQGTPAIAPNPPPPPFLGPDDYLDEVKRSAIQLYMLTKAGVVALGEAGGPEERRTEVQSMMVDVVQALEDHVVPIFGQDLVSHGPRSISTIRVAGALQVSGPSQDMETGDPSLQPTDTQESDAQEAPQFFFLPLPRPADRPDHSNVSPSLS